MKKLILPFVLCLTIPISYGQSLKINNDVDTVLYEIAEPLNLWLDFLKAETDSIGSQYWNKAELDKFGLDNYFLVENELYFGVKNYHRIFRGSDITVLSISYTEDWYKIKTMLAFPTEDSTRTNVMFIFNVYAKKENGQLKLYNAQGINEELLMSHQTVGYINFHYPKHHEFNLELATKQNDFLVKFSRDFGVSIDTADYYFAETLEELRRLKGIDFAYTETTNNIPSGIADSQNKTVYGAGLGEYYPHEFIHFMINPQYPDAHNWFNEGLCTYYGMSRGKDLEWHLKRTAEYLKTHAEVDLDSMLNYRNVDNMTSYRYVLGGYFMKKAFEKGGIELQKKLLQTGKTDEDFYQAIEKYFGIKQQDLNEVIRKDLFENYLD